MSENRIRPEYWRTATVLPSNVMSVWRKPELSINPVAIVATVDEKGNPHTAPFGSLRAMTPDKLRLICLRYHDTYTNLFRDGRVVAVLVASPDIAVSVYGTARLICERMEYDENYALFEIDIENVKNDMVRTVTIDSGIMITPREEFGEWFDWGISELEDIC
jgi:hypothetical protein